MEMFTRLGRATKIAFIVLVVALIASIGFFVWDRYSGETSSVLDYEAQNLEEYLQENPTNPNAWTELADISLQQRNYDKAISAYEQALELGGPRPDVLMGLGLAYMKKGDTDQAVAYFNQAIALSEEEGVAQTTTALATLHYYLGKIYLETGEIDLAAEELTESLKYNRINADTIYLLGRVYEAQGDDAAAEANYLLALSLVPNFAEVYYQLGELHEARGDGPMAAYNHAMAALFSGEVAESVEQLSTIVASLPQNADAHWGLGWGYEKLNMMEEAIAAYRQAVSIDPEHRLASGALTRLGADLYQE